MILTQACPPSAFQDSCIPEPSILNSIYGIPPRPGPQPNNTLAPAEPNVYRNRLSSTNRAMFPAMVRKSGLRSLRWSEEESLEFCAFHKCITSLRDGGNRRERPCQKRRSCSFVSHGFSPLPSYGLQPMWFFRNRLIKFTKKRRRRKGAPPKPAL
jgi:hypothetical protein